MAGRRGADRPHVDQLALVVTVDGVFAPSAPAGSKAPFPAPVSVDALARTLNTALAHKRLQTVGTIAQVWVLGGAVDLLKWAPDPVQRKADMTDVQVRDLTRERLKDKVGASAAALENNGWRLREGWKNGGCWVRLEKIRTPEEIHKGMPVRRVDVMLEPYAWTTGGALDDGNTREKLGVLGTPAGGTGIPDSDIVPEDARCELSRRLGWLVEHLGMLPAVTGSATGAAMVGHGWRAGEHINAENAAKRDAAARTGDKKFKAHDVVIPEGPGPIPPLAYDAPPGDIEPRLAWWRLPSADEIAAAATLVVPDRRGSYLGSAGASLVLGDPVPLIGADIDAEPQLWMPGAPEADPAKWPRGLWLLLLPPADEVPGWDELPPFHQTWWRRYARTGDRANAPDSAPVPVWVTTETAAAMATEPRKIRKDKETGEETSYPTGGLGLQWCRENVPIMEAWVWERCGTALKPWQTTMSAAYRAALAEGDQVMRAIVGDVYKSYIGRMHKSADDWGQWRAAHSQPVWRNQIHALTTVSIRRKSAEARDKIAAATGLDCSPVAATTDDTTWLLPAAVAPELVADDDSDGRYYLGRMVIKVRRALSDDDRAALLAARAEGTAAFAAAVMALRKATTGDTDDDPAATAAADPAGVQ